MHIRLKYGEEGLGLEFPETSNFVGVLYPQEAEVLPVPEDAVQQSLLRPIESKPLKELSRGKTDAVIVISDITRPVPNALLLPIIIRHLEAAGIPPAKITILIATGIHRPNEGTGTGTPCRQRDRLILPDHQPLLQEPGRHGSGRTCR